jgi:DNA processing protein
MIDTPFPPPHVITPGHPHWPDQLSELPNPPAQLAYSGQLPDWSKAVAIVGTRRTDAFGCDFTRGLARELAEAGCVIVSGGALGIDREAHEGALEAGGITVAILPTGLARPYPAQNRELFQRILERGCVASEIRDEVPGYDSAFLERNRLVAALAKVVVVTQAPLASGAMSTAAHARKLGRPVLAVPYTPGIVRGEGCLALLSGGAGVCRTSGDVLLLAAPGQAIRSPHRPRRPKKVTEFQWLDEDETALVQALEGGPLDADELCDAAALPAPRVQRAILLLLLSKVIQEVGGGRYGRTDYP